MPEMWLVPGQHNLLDIPQRANLFPRRLWIGSRQQTSGFHHALAMAQAGGDGGRLRSAAQRAGENQVRTEPCLTRQFDHGAYIPLTFRDQLPASVRQPGFPRLRFAVP